MFSKDLEVSIANLFDKAQEINIQYLTVEHLFLMILNDYDVKDFIETQNVSVDTLKDELNEHLKKSSIMRTDNQKAVQPTLGFQRVLQRAVFHIQSSGKGVVKPINLLVAIFSEKESRSVYILNKNNINFIVSYGYSKIIKKDIIEAYKDSIINLHISFLPFNKGAHPNLWSHIEKTKTGVTIHKIDEGIDTGEILFRKEVIINTQKHTFNSSYNLLRKEIEILFQKNWGKIKSKSYKVILDDKILYHICIFALKCKSELFGKHL